MDGIEDLLEYKISDPEKAYKNYCRIAKISNQITRISSALWDLYEEEAFDTDWHEYLYSVDWYSYLDEDPDSNIDPVSKKQLYCQLSPEDLSEAGFVEGDELWSWCTDEISWEHYFGRAGWCIVRGGKVVWHIITTLN